MNFNGSYSANFSITAGQRLQIVGYDKTGNTPGTVTTIYSAIATGAEIPANTSVTLSLLEPTLTSYAAS